MNIRKAKLCDAGEIHALMQPYVRQGLLLPRPLAYICENIRDFSVAEDPQGRILACGALHFLDEDVAELQSLAVDAGAQGHGLGSALVRHLLKEAREYQAWKAFALTHAPEFFYPFGFEKSDMGQLTQKFNRDCLRCPKLNLCHQVPVICDVFQAPLSSDEGARARHEREALLAPALPA